MGCDRTMDWIWETPRPTDEQPPDVASHLADCAPCRAQLQARLDLVRDLRGYRSELEEDPSPGLEARVLAAAAAAVEAQATGKYPVRADPLEEMDIPDDIADDLADSIAEDFGAQFAAMTTGRLRAARESGSIDTPTREPAAAPAPSVAPPAPSPTLAPSSGWQPPRATVQWMVAAALVLGAALIIGISAGRMSTHIWPVPGAGMATIAATGDGVIVSQRNRVHTVGLSPDGIEALSQGNTYLLAGPMDGPYEVVGVVTWGQVDTAALPAVDRGEIVVAVGPAGGWSRGKSLAMNDLAGDAEILGRRALSPNR